MGRTSWRWSRFLGSEGPVLRMATPLLLTGLEALSEPQMNGMDADEEDGV